MAEAPEDEGLQNKEIQVFNNYSSEELEQLLIAKDKVNTQKATDSAVKTLKQYLAQNKLPEVDDLDQENLAKILFQFYASV